MSILLKRYDFPLVQAPGEKVTQSIELERDTERVVGLTICASRDDMLFHRGTIEISLSNREVIPENYHCKLLMSGLGVPPEERYLPLDLEPGNGMLKAIFQDNNSPVQPFGGPYTVSLYLQTRNKPHA